MQVHPTSPGSASATTSGRPPARLRSARGRWIVAATGLGSSMALLDATVVNVALPRIAQATGSGLAGLQWVVTGYTVTLAAFILLGGTLSDRYGRRRIFLVGTVGFAVTSLTCGLAPGIATLIAARIVQGIAAALLTPGSLALISASIDSRDRGAAVGLWSGLTGVAGAIGPLAGGWLVQLAGWRLVFLVNLPIALVVVAVTARHVPESRDPHVARTLDISGTLAVVAGLGALTYGLTDSRWPLTVAGVVLLTGFVVHQGRTDHPLMPLSLFTSRTFVTANLVTVAAYAALGGVLFLLLLQLQTVLGYTPLAAGAATLPITVVMLALSSHMGRWAQRHAPRLPMVTGCLLAAVGVLLMLGIRSGGSYLFDVAPAVTLLGLGLAVLVAPLTASVLDSVPTEEAGTASGVNNAIARTAQLLAVAALPALAGITGTGGRDAAAFSQGFHLAMLICAGLLGAAAVLALLGSHARPAHGRHRALLRRLHCAVAGPPPQPRPSLVVPSEE